MAVELYNLSYLAISVSILLDVTQHPVLGQCTLNDKLLRYARSQFPLFNSVQTPTAISFPYPDPGGHG